MQALLMCIQPARLMTVEWLSLLGLKGHYLGANNIDTLSSTVEHKLKMMMYKGEMHHWNFEKFTKVHVNQHAILDGLVEHGYSGINERSKVHHLMEGIKTNKLDAVKTQILSSPPL